MVKTDNDAFLLGLGKVFSQTRDSGSAYVTIKRSIAPENGKYRPGNKAKNKLTEQLKKDSADNPKKKFNLEVKAKNDKKNISTTVESGKAGSFATSVANIFRLNMFKVPKIIKKKIRKPTSKDPKSKRSQKLKARLQFKKLKKLKKKERKLLKKAATLKSATKDSKIKMEIE